MINMSKLRTKYIEARCITIMSFLMITLFVGNGTVFAQKKKINTIEEIRKHLSELLISRGDIKEFSFAINIERLFPNEDLSKFEDSPAEFILAMLYGSQLILPETWNELLLQADSLNMNQNAKFLKVYNYERAKDSFEITCVLKQWSKYYAFSSVVLGWKNDKYVMRVYKKLKEYDNIKELEENPFSIAMEEEMEELKELENNSTDLDFRF